MTLNMADWPDRYCSTCQRRYAGRETKCPECGDVQFGLNPRSYSMAPRKKPNVLDLPVSFGGVSIGDGTCRIGVTCDRGNLTVERADENLCGHRLTGKIEVKPKGEQPDQGVLPGMAEPGLEGSFDVKGYRVTEKEIGFGMTFAVRDTDVGHLAKFAKRDGRLVVQDVAAIESEEAEEEPGDGDFEE